MRAIIRAPKRKLSAVMLTSISLIRLPCAVLLHLLDLFSNSPAILTTRFTRAIDFYFVFVSVSVLLS